MKGKKSNVKKAGFRMGLISMLVIGIMVGYMTLPTPVLKQDNDTGSWHIVWEGSLTALAAEADPGAGNTGFLSVYFINHSAGNDYSAVNNSDTLEGWSNNNSLGFANADNTEVDLAHSTSFDVVFRVRGNATNCKVGAVWFDTNLKIQWTCAGLTVGADTELTKAASEGVATSNATAYTFLYMNFWDDNGGSGFTISQDQTVEITSIKLLAYY